MSIFRRKPSAAKLIDREAIDLEEKGDFLTAAETRAKQASLDYAETDNELILADDCVDAAKDFIKAGDAPQALDQARRALQAYMLDDWLAKDSDEEYLHDLIDIVSCMHDGGHLNEAIEFLNDINAALAKFGREPVAVAVLGTLYRFPDVCPHCGAALHATGVTDEIECPYCAGCVHAVTPRN